MTERLLRLSMDLVARRGWTALSLWEVAQAAGLTEDELRDVFASKSALLQSLQAVQAQALADGNLQDTPPDRDALFEQVMIPFEALQPYREGLAVVIRDSLSSPRSLGQILQVWRGALDRTDRFWGGGLRAILAQKALGLVILATLRVWVSDDSPDLGKTMATLEQSLERLLRLCPLHPEVPRTEALK